MESNKTIYCPSCNSKITGNFCSECGERRKRTDFTFKAFISSFFEVLFNLDSKFLKSLNLLLFKPGFLTSEFFRGSRVKYIKPIQLFVIMNIIMFFVLSFTDSSIFRTNFYMQTNLMPYSSLTKYVAHRQNEDLKLSKDEYISKFDARLKDYSKSLIFLLIPLFAIALKMTNRKILYAKHLVFSTHYFSFVLFFIGIISTTVVMIMSFILKDSFNNSIFSGDEFFVPFAFTFFFIYQYLALRKVYNDSRIFASIKSILLIFFWFLALTVYRFVLFLIVYLSLKVF